MDATKFKILEVIIKNRRENFDTIQVELITAFQEMSWESIRNFLYLLKKEGYIKTLSGDDDLIAVHLQSDTIARLHDEKEKAKDVQIKELINRIIRIL